MFTNENKGAYHGSRNRPRARICVPCLAAVFAAEPDAGAGTFAGDAAAQTQGGGRWKACGDDVKKFCANVDKGKGQVRTCLDSHAAELSDSCKTARAEHAAKKDAPAQ